MEKPCWLGGRCAGTRCVWFVEPGHCSYWDSVHHLTADQIAAADYAQGGGETLDPHDDEETPGIFAGSDVTEGEEA